MHVHIFFLSNVPITNLTDQIVHIYYAITGIGEQSVNRGMDHHLSVSTLINREGEADSEETASSRGTSRTTNARWRFWWRK